MRISKIIVTKLFGLYDHTIELNEAENITILHGQNGVGKTTILKMVNFLFTTNFIELSFIPFEKFQVVFNDESLLSVITKPSFISHDEPSVEVESKMFNVRYDRNETEIFTFYLTNFPTSKSKSNSFLGGSKSRFPKDSKEQQLKKMVVYINKEEISEVINPSQFAEDFLSINSDWESLTEEIAVDFIETQRLQDMRRGAFGDELDLAIDSYSQDVVEEIQDAISMYAEKSQELDRTFPARLVRYNSEKNLNIEDIKVKLTELEARREQLVKIGLLDETSQSTGLDLDSIDETNRTVFSVYVQDNEQKLGVFDQLQKRIEVFTSIINSRFLHKRLRISREAGFKVNVVVNNEGTKELSLDSLSSGEQHELVLFYKLLFNTQPNSLVLIDEPEISLHAGWQVRFLEDLGRVIGLSNIYVLIATHSAAIINKEWKLTVRLQSNVA